MASVSIFTSQPGKLIYTLFVLGTNAVRLPFWMLYFIPSVLRQNSRWTYTQALGVRIVKAYLSFASAIEMRTTIDLRSGGEGARFVTVRPGKPDRYVGAVAQDAEIRPVIIGGTWYPASPGSASAVGKVALHFHGGAYVIGDGRTTDVGFAAKTILSNTPVSHVFAPQYRLASNPGGRFPAFLQDGITSFLYLTETLNIPAENITISGDSAGGHLCLALLRYIADNPVAKLANPSCAWLWSAWGNPAAALEPGALKTHRHEPTDYLVERFGMWGARAIRPSKASGITLEHPNVCILGNAFATPTPLFFLTGECEVLYDDAVRMYEEFKAIQGNKVGLWIATAAVHDFILVGHIVRFHKEAALAAERAGEFWKANGWMMV
ncbi:hypothetical protein V495_00270 [Pseudogymnoascus sp. VKM F-4514 (FW-929)]|nr:hypothetical protein V495_00270 [Pseudogymnoascus sp. VKM F-4514 (FW-929)]KFY67134.1 hypothetical protein V497_00563 [Pseudogymnoascus sp. VKM F-4516 (FW-969)]